MEFKDTLRDWMKQGRWTSVLLAEKTGLTASAISHFINGRRKPCLDNFKKLCEAMDIPGDVLLDWEIK